MIKKLIQSFLRRLVKPVVIEKTVIYDKAKVLDEEVLQAFAKHTTAKYGITYEDLKSDFNPGRFRDKAEEIFWERYSDPNGYGEPMHVARDLANTHGMIFREEKAKWRAEVQQKIAELKKKFSVAIKKAYQDLEKEL